MSAQRTPGPWQTIQATQPNGIERSRDWAIMDCNQTLLAEAFEIVGYDADGDYQRLPAAANAAFIVQACNAHDELVAALRAAVEVIKVWHNMGGAESVWPIYLRSCPEMKPIRDALAKLGAQS